MIVTPSHTRHRLLIGSYTDGRPFFETAAGKGISLWRWDSGSGLLESDGMLDGLFNPSFMAVSGDQLFTVSEAFLSDGRLLSFDLSGASPKKLWNVSSAGAAPCHLAVLPSGKQIAAANYLGGSVIVCDARSGAEITRITYEGSGPVTTRQEKSHAHQVSFSPGGTWMLVCDLGADAIWRHRLKQGCYSPGKSEKVPMPPGSGPRHLRFSHHGDVVYILGELDGMLHLYQWHESDGFGSHLQSVSIAPEKWDAAHSGSAVKLHPSSHRLYAAHRGSKRIVFFDVAEDGSLLGRGCFDAGGSEPRDFNFSPCGTFLLVASQNDNRVAIHSLCPKSGHSIECRHLSVGSPACLLWA